MRPLTEKTGGIPPAAEILGPIILREFCELRVEIRVPASCPFATLGLPSRALRLTACWYTTSRNELALLQRRRARSSAHDVHLCRARILARHPSAGQPRPRPLSQEVHDRRRRRNGRSAPSKRQASRNHQG